MYHKNFTSSFSATGLSSFLAERITSTNKIAIISEDSELVFDQFKIAWKKQYSKVSAERDNEEDIKYLATLREIISIMQQADFKLGDGSTGAKFLVTNPEEVNPDICQERQILVCCDEASLKTYIRILKAIKTDVVLLVTFLDVKETINRINNLSLLPVSEAEVRFRKLLKEQKHLSRKIGIDIDGSLISDKVLEEIKVLRGKSGDKENLVEYFTNNQRQISQLRSVCGRAKAHRSLSYNAIHNLKLLTSHLVHKETDNSDYQLFDDPFGEEWTKASKRLLNETSL